MQNDTPRSLLGQLAAQLIDDYRTRILLAVTVSLGLLILFVHIPFGPVGSRVGWISAPFVDRLPVDIVQVYEESGTAGGTDALATDFGLENDTEVKIESAVEGSDADDSFIRRDVPLGRIRAQNVLNFAEQQPELVGGLGSFYLNIDYPEEARTAGIQGRLILAFTVDIDGRTRDIMVEKSLHPLCDSAAVDALRRSHFIAGRHNGERVAVRMRLPVRFQLVEMPEQPALSSSLD